MNAWVQFFFLPLTVFVYGLDFMVRTLQSFQQTTQQLVPAIPNPGPLPLTGGGLDRSTPIGGALGGGATTTPKEVRKMSDCCCNNQCGEKFCEVRVYEYYILSIKPCAERMIDGPASILVTTNMSGEAFTAYVIAMYCQDHRIPREDAQYLRVCYRINCTFPKEQQDCCNTYGRDQAQALGEIRDILRDRWGGDRDTASTTGTAAGTTSVAGDTGTTGTTTTGGKGGRGGTASASAGA